MLSFQIRNMEFTHTWTPVKPAFFSRDTTESDRKRKRAQEDKSKMGEGESKREEGTMKDGEGWEPEAKKKKQSKDDTSSYSEDEDDDEEASFQMCSLDGPAVCNKEKSQDNLCCFFFSS